MLDQNQLTPEEAHEQNQPLIQDLRRYFNTLTEDNASLARIHTRLIEKTATSLPVDGNDRVARTPPLLQGRPERYSKRKFRQVFAKDRSRNHILGTLAAAILLIALVGSFALLTHGGQGTGAVKHGWSLMAQFSGTGSQTIGRQNIEVGHKFGWLILCDQTHSGGVAVMFNDNVSGSGWSTCSSSEPVPLEPEGSVTSPTVLPSIQTIKVTTDASTSWDLFLFKGTYYPPLSMDNANWHPLLNEMDGSGDGTWAVNATLPRTWGLLFVCHGTGDIQISLQSNNMSDRSGLAGASTLCNGQINFDVSDAPGQSLNVSQVQITTGAENDWQVLLVSCTNGKPHCGTTIVTPTSTP